MSTAGGCPHPPPHHKPQDLRKRRMFVQKTIPYALLHSSRFISWLIFALLLITEAAYDASGVTPGEDERHRWRPLVTADTTECHFFEKDIKSALICSHLSVSSIEGDYLLHQIINLAVMSLIEDRFACV